MRVGLLEAAYDFPWPEGDGDAEAKVTMAIKQDEKSSHSRRCLGTLSGWH